MSVQTGWTPASRPGIVALRPLTFGTILGRSFAALRQNPRVLLGFALVVQTVAYLVTIVGVGAVAFWAFSRLDTVPLGSEDYDTIMIGSFVIVFVAGLVLGVPTAAVVVLVQGVVVAEVSAEVVAEKLTLGDVWRRVKPAAWRLIAWAALEALAVGLAFALVAAGLIALGVVAPFIAIPLGILLALGAIPLGFWLYVKLLLVPAVLIVEHAGIGTAIGRSWRLIRSRFWVAFGAVFVISTIFSVIAQAVSLPLTLASSFLTSIFAPTGDTDATGLITLVVATVGVQALVLLVQSVGAIVQSTATALVYVDCRMRHEGLDLDLQAYVERRDSGDAGLPDPYRQHIGREIAPRIAPVFVGAGYAATYPPAAPGAGYPTYPPAAPGAGYPTYPPAAPGAGYPTYPPAPGSGYQTAPRHPAYPPYAEPTAPPVPPVGRTPGAPGGPTASAPPVPPAPLPVPPAPRVPLSSAEPAATAWTAPGSVEGAPEPESPWR